MGVLCGPLPNFFVRLLILYANVPSPRRGPDDATAATAAVAAIDADDRC